MNALYDRAGLVDGGHRIVWARGTDAHRFLHDLLSQNVAELGDGAAKPSLLLAPTGRLRAVLVVAQVGGDIALISTEHDNVLEDLTRFRIRVDVELELDQRPVRLLWGPMSAAVIEAAGLPNGRDASRNDSHVVVRDPVIRDRWFVTGDFDSLDVEQIDAEAARRRSIELGEPAFGIDIDESTIPNEVFNLSDVVDFEKGCYLGQELVERIDARGRRVKRWAGVVLDDGSPVPPTPCSVVVGEKVVGALTSTTFSDELGRAVGLGLIRSEIDGGGAVEVRWDDGSVEGVVRSVPFLTVS